MTPGPIHGDTADFRAEPSELGEQLVVQHDLIAADRAPVGRIEEKEERLRAKILEADCLIGRGLQEELRRVRTRWQWHWAVPPSRGGCGLRRAGSTGPQRVCQP